MRLPESHTGGLALQPRPIGSADTAHREAYPRAAKREGGQPTIRVKAALKAPTDW